jgi:DNA repair protein RecO (recombination protein O)
MRVSDKAIVLQSIKHGDKKFILKLYTSQHGLITVIAAAGNSKSSKIRPGNILPLTLVDIEFILKQNREIHRLTEATSYHVHDHISLSLAKLAIAQFMNEIMIRSLKEQHANAHLFEFIETCLKFLNDATDNYMNLHLYFLLELSRYLGFEPQNNHSADAPYFDCREGRFSMVNLSFPLGLSQAESLFFNAVLKSNLLKTTFTNNQRQTLLEILVAYYKLHIPAFNEVKSIQVLKEVLSG